jgi:glycosyltransferase involved in cell wall biosynthesis
MVSVIIPMYNSSKTILQSVESVLKQTYREDFEIIVVNDGSTDDSLSIIEKFKRDNHKINLLIVDQPNGGVQMARNAGLRMAKGEWIALLDSDDYWLPDKIEKQMAVLTANSTIDFLGCNRNNEEIKVLWSKKNKLSKVKFKELLIKMYPQTSTTIFKRSILTDVGLYDEGLRYGEDGDYWLRICAKKEMYFMPESLVITGGGKPNFGFTGMTSNLSKMEKGNLRVLYKNLELKNINVLEYALLRGYYLIKYIRRRVLTNIR